MPWFKTDDKLHSHRKARKAGVAAMGLWVLAGSWSSDQLTDGFVPDYIAASIDPDYQAHAASLVAAGLWVVESRDGDEGWLFHDWADQNPLKAKVEKKREEARDRMREVREKSYAGSRSVRANTEGTSHEVLITPTRPVPEPLVPTEQGEASEPDAPRQDVDDLCGLLADLMEANGSKRPRTDTKAWRDPMRRLLDLDGRQADEVGRAIRWCQANDFWARNIHSPAKLREKYDRLRMDAAAERQRAVQPVQTVKARAREGVMAGVRQWAQDQDERMAQA